MGLFYSLVVNVVTPIVGGTEDPILPLVHLDPAGQCWLDSAVNLGASPMGLLGPLDPIHATRVEAQKSMLTNDGELLIQAQLSLGDTM